MKGRPSIGAIFILGSLWLLACGAMTVTSRDMHITEPMFTASTPSTAPKGRQAQMTAVNDDSPQFQPRMVAADSFTCIVVPLWTAWSSCVPPTPCAFRGLTLRVQLLQQIQGRSGQPCPPLADIQDVETCTTLGASDCASCTNQVLDTGEVDVDCGRAGGCDGCRQGQHCNVNADCETPLLCSLVTATCVSPEFRSLPKYVSGSLEFVGMTKGQWLAPAIVNGLESALYEHINFTQPDTPVLVSSLGPLLLIRVEDVNRSVPVEVQPLNAPPYNVTTAVIVTAGFATDEITASNAAAALTSEVPALLTRIQYSMFKLQPALCGLSLTLPFQAEFSWESPLIVSPSPPPPAPNLLAHKSGLIVGAAIGTAAVVVVVMWVGFRVSVRASSPPKPPSGDATKTVSPTSPELQVASQLELVRPVIAFRTPAKDVRFVPSPMVSRQGTSSSVSVPIMPLPPPWLRQPRRWTPRARRSSTSRGPPASMSPLFVLRNQAAATKTPGPAAPKQNT